MEPLVLRVLLAEPEELEQLLVEREQQPVSLALVSQQGRREQKRGESSLRQEPRALEQLLLAQGQESLVQALLPELAQPLLEAELPLGRPHRSHLDHPVDRRSPWGVRLACHHGQKVALVVEHQAFLVGRRWGICPRS